MQLLLLLVVGVAVLGGGSRSASHTTTNADNTKSPTTGGTADHTAQDAAAVAVTLIQVIQRVYDAVKED